MSRLTRNTHTGVLSFGNGNCPHITIRRGISISLSWFPVPNHYAISFPKGKNNSFPLQRLKQFDFMKQLWETLRVGLASTNIGVALFYLRKKV